MIMSVTSGGVKSEGCSNDDAEATDDGGEYEEEAGARKPGREASYTEEALVMDDDTDDVDNDGDAGA